MPLTDNGTAVVRDLRFGRPTSERRNAGHASGQTRANQLDTVHISQHICQEHSLVVITHHGLEIDIKVGS